MTLKSLNRLSIVISFLIILVGSLLVALPAFGPLNNLLANYVVDDSFYFLLPALNYGNGAGISFDGIHATNGFQPLWMFLLLPLGVFIDDRLLMLRSALVFQALLFAAAVAVVVWAALRHQRWITALLFPVIALLFGLRHDLNTSFVTNGLESALFFLMLALGFAATLTLTQDDDPTTQTVILALLVLTRIDAIFIAAALWLYGVAHRLPIHGVGRTVRDYGRGILLGGVLLLLYFFWSWYRTGLLMPVSGQIKMWESAQLTTQQFGGRETVAFWQQIGTVFAESVAFVISVPATALVFQPVRETMEFRNSLIQNAGTIYPVVTVIVLLIVPRLWHVAARPRSEGRAWNGVLAALGLGALVHLAVHSITLWPFARYNTWHYISQLFVVLLLTATLLEWLLRPLQRRSAIAALLSVLLLGAGLVWAQQTSISQTIASRSEPPRVEESERLGLYRAALWGNHGLPTGRLLGAFNAGTAGYFSESPLINLDGLINDATLFHNRKAGIPIANYLAQEQIDYLIDYAPLGDYPIAELGSVHYVDLYQPESAAFVMNLRASFLTDEGEGLLAAWPVTLRLPTGEMEQWIGTAWALPADEVDNHVWFVANPAGEFEAGPFTPDATWFHGWPPPPRHSEFVVSYRRLPPMEMQETTVVVHNLDGMPVIGPAEREVTERP